MMQKMFVVLSIALVVMAGSVAQAAVIFQDDFESYGAGDQINTGDWTAPDSWLVSGGGFHGNYANGATCKVVGAPDAVYATVDVARLDSGVKKLSAGLYFVGVLSEFGLNDPGAEGCSLNWVSRTDGTIGFYSEAYYGNGGRGIDMVGMEIYQLLMSEIVLDYDNSRLMATLTNAATQDTATTGWLDMHDNIGFRPNALYAYNYINGENGICFDDVVLSDVPEPSSIIALLSGLAGTVCLLRRRTGK